MPVPRPAPCHPDRIHYGKEMCKPCYQQAWKAANPNYHPAKKAHERYGLTLEEYRTMRNGPCDICGKPAEVIDHDHRTGRIRGRLCHKCNRGIGLLQDKPELVDIAATYLHGEPR